MTSPDVTNPLLQPRFRVPFDRIRAEHIEPAAAELLREARAALARLAEDGASRTYDNTLRALDEFTEPLDWAMAVVRHLESVATYPELRAAFNAVQGEVSAFYTGIPLDAGLWRNIKEFAATAEAGALGGERRRYLEKTVETFRRHGADLDAAGKKRLEEIDVELTKLTTKFSENVLDSTNAFELILGSEPELAGLPPTARESARQSAQRKGLEGWRFTLHAPDYFAVMTYLDDARVRRRVYEAFAVRATEAGRDNRPLIVRILELRRQKAELLGFQHFADLVLEDRMAHNGAGPSLFWRTSRARPRGASPGRIASCTNSAARWKVPARRKSRPGTWRTTRKSSAPRSTISMKRRSARISRWSGWWRVFSNWWGGSTAFGWRSTAAFPPGTRR